MIEIDEEVIHAAATYMPQVSRGAFSDPKADIVITDANEYLEVNDGFDVIIYDLTMHPESITNVDRTEFLDRIFSKIRNSLNTRGIVSMQCCSEFDEETVALLNKILPRYFDRIQFRTTFIPSFCENWVFASAEAK